MRTVGSSTLRGGQTVFHGLRMWGQLLRAGAFLAAFAVVAFPAWSLWNRSTGYEWYAAGMVTMAEAKRVLGYEADARQDVRMRDGTYRVLTITEIARSPGARRARERLLDEILLSALIGAKASVAAIALFLLLFWLRGRALNRARRIRGVELATARELGRRVRPAHRRLAGLLSLSPDPGPYRIAGVLWAKGVTENRVLVDHLLKTELTALAEAMEGTVAQSIVDPDNPKTALSVRAMLTANLSALEVLPDTGPPFSIRDWISDEAGGGFLLLTSRGDQHASLRGLISTWLEIAVNAMLSLDQDEGRRIWVVLDELPTLHQVPSLQPGLAESRQFGGCFVLGIQVVSALRDLYGRNGAETISGLCGTRVVLAAPDEDTARWSAGSLGRAEVEEVAEGFSYGANTIRDGVSLTPKRELRPLALASEIMQLPALAGYLRFPGPLPVARIALDYVKRAKAAERFVPRREATEPPSPAADETETDAGAPESGPEAPAPTEAGPPDPEPASVQEEPAWVMAADEAAADAPTGAGAGNDAAPAQGAAPRGSERAAAGKGRRETPDDARAAEPPAGEAAHASRGNPPGVAI